MRKVTISAILILVMLFSNAFAKGKTPFDRIIEASKISFSKKDRAKLKDIGQSFSTGDPGIILTRYINKLESVRTGKNLETIASEQADKLIFEIENAVSTELDILSFYGMNLDGALTIVGKRSNKFLDIPNDIHIKNIKNLISNIIDGYRIKHSLTSNKLDDENQKEFKEIRKDILETFKLESRKVLIESLSLLNNYNIFESNDSLFFELFPEILQSSDKLDEFGDDVDEHGGRAGWIEEGRRSLTESYTTGHTETFDARVKIAFLGSELSAGPSITFERRYEIDTTLTAPGDEPIVKEEGIQGALNHHSKRRIVFTCNVSAQARHGIKGSATLNVFGTGTTVEAGAWQGLLVTQRSNFKFVPYNNRDNERTSLKDVVEYCKGPFFKSVKRSLDIELKLAARELVFHSHLTQCVKDEHCNKWFNNRLGICQIKTKPICSERTKGEDTYNICELRGTKGSACSVYDSDGKRLTPGYFEYKCDKGFSCKIIQEGGWFTNWSIYSDWKAECR